MRLFCGASDITFWNSSTHKVVDQIEGQYHGGRTYRIAQKILDFSTNCNPLGVPPSFQEAILQNLDTFAKYPDQDYRMVKKEIGNYYKVETNNILLGNGAVDVLYRLAACLPCKQAVIAAPAFSEYRKAFALSGIPVEEKILFDFQTGQTQLEALAESCRAETAVILCNPSNPTGTLIKKETLLRLYTALAEKRCFLLVDECFLDFCLDEKETLLEQISQLQNLIIIRAATKFFGLPGIRFGYGFTANQAVKKTYQLRLEPWNLNTAAVLAAGVIYQDVCYIEKTKNWIKEQRPQLYHALCEMPELFVYPTTTNFFLLKLQKQDCNAYWLFEKLLAKGIFIRKPIGFTGLEENYFRIAVKLPKENEALLLALHTVLKEE